MDGLCSRGLGGAWDGGGGEVLYTSCSLLGAIAPCWCCCRAVVSVVVMKGVGECRSNRLHMDALTKTTRDGRRSPFSRLFSGLVCFFYSFALRRPCVDTFSSDRKHKPPRDGTLDLPPVVVILSTLYLSSSARLFFLPSPSSPFRGGIEFLITASRKRDTSPSIVWSQPSTVMKVGRGGACLAVPS